MNVPFHKAYITDEEIKEVIDVLRSGWLTMGPKTVIFEKLFNEYIGAKYSIALSSCTAALHLALKAVGLKEGEEVIVPTNTFTATGEVVCYSNAKPVLVDIERESHNIKVNSIEAAINASTKAIVPVHFGGQPCDIDEIKELAKRRGIYLIEDGAHTLPSFYKGKKIGTIGDMTCFSFYATKTVVTGDGGMITTDNREWAEKIKILRHHGISSDAWKRYSMTGSWYYEVVDAGYKYNITDIQAALGVAQLKKVELMWEMRKKIAWRYTDELQRIESIITPVEKPDRESSWHLYVIKLVLETLNINRAQFIQLLKERGINTSVHFIPLHRHPFYRDKFGYKNEQFPDAEWVYERAISLPIYPGMSEAEVDYVIENIIDLCKKFKK